MPYVVSIAPSDRIVDQILVIIRRLYTHEVEDIINADEKEL